MHRWLFWFNSDLYIKYKNDAVKAFEKYVTHVAVYGKMKSVRINQGADFTPNAFESLLIKIVIINYNY